MPTDIPMNEPPTPSEDASLKVGVDQFNQGEYYACHDTLEAIWMEATVSEKPFFQGILQLAVALYHLGNHNWRGAAILLGEGIRRLEPFEPNYRQVDVTALLDCADDWLAAIQQLGPEQVALLAEALAQTSRGQSGSGATAALPKWEIRPSP
jgi:predicted metal-dependent hydrolase